ncbi:hypothetical protein [Microbacterium allomyrinae]|uniref:Uncharacterized protein n=1 Tax=Microbacterium allomyrinae TaxID=2830666 RepID=A0A9X1S3R2_9MICO|nr:hypothetical protein [Microbacterium allomyrinae]MCC2032265.1 hypothetical protein [Microbacterium allomyrinae]
MSTSEQPESPPLTRKQLRDIRNTGSNPVIIQNADAPAADITAPSEPVAPAAPVSALPIASAPLPRPSEPTVVSPPPAADSTVDLGVSPLTRRQARQQERIRTASVPVITPEVIAAHGGATPAFAFPSETSAPTADPDAGEPGSPGSEDQVTTDADMQELFGPPATATESEVSEASALPWVVGAAASVGSAESSPSGPGRAAIDSPEADDPWSFPAEPEAEASADEADDQAKAVVNPMFGAGLLAGESPAPVSAAPEMPASFDQLLARSTGAISLQNTLIVSQAPEIAPLVAPVTATGEVLVTGTFNLPEGLGSTGHAKGTTDGKEIDATLVDGELPSHSSPTPIAASAAVSTVKTPGEVIRPPVPEKGSRLMMTLAITAGALALALVGVLILAFVTGVF